MTAVPPSFALQALERHVSPLHRQVRGAVIARLATELTGREPDTDRGPEQLVTLVLRMKQIAEDQLLEQRRLDQQWAELSRRYYRRTDDAGRRQVLADHLTETVADPVARRADLAALDRFLDHEALRERHLIARHEVLVALEIAVAFLGGAGPAALEAAAPRGRERLVREMFEAGQLTHFLHQIAETGVRWQLRRAALDGLHGFAVAARAAPDARATLHAAHLGLAMRCATEPLAHPWVQGAALRLVLELADDLGLDLIAKRLFEPPAARSPGARRDFLVRRQCVELLASGDHRALDLLRRLHALRDPSEHVRQGLAEAFARLAAFAELGALVDADREPSARVRGAAIRAACRHAGPVELPVVLALVIEVLDRDPDPLPLAIACDDAPLAIARRDPATSLDLLLGALLRLAANPRHASAVHERAAAAAETIATVASPVGQAWTTFLAQMTREIEPGRRRAISLARLHLPPLPADPTFLGRILAGLARTDYPLCVTRRRDRLIVWRGDRVRRRLWRLLHELRTPRPNKRQAHRHTVGRVMKGHLRAPPGGLDEVTATVVPGERVLVAEEGGWGRHLPSVDDVLDLPILSRDPVHVFSSHGVTTIRPPARWTTRLWNRLRLAVSYAALAAQRLQSLRGSEPHLRQRYAEQLREGYGIELAFTRYDYPRHRAAAAAHLTSLFAREERG